MQSSRAVTLDERISTDPVMQTEFVVYVYFQYNEDLKDEDVIASVDSVVEGKANESPEGSLDRAIASSLLGQGQSKNRFSEEDAITALRKMKLEIEGARKEGHDFLSDLVIRDYHIFEQYLIGAYTEFMNRTSSLASVHNYLDAEMEIYRAACFCFPGVRKHADEVFSHVYTGAQGGGGEPDESVRRVEFLQWFVSQYVIPAIDTVASEWYFTRFRRHLNQRVLPIFRDVLQQRRSVFVVKSRSKNSVVLDDLLYAESFGVKMSDANALEKGNVIECTLVRYASSNRINSIVRLISPEEAERVISEINSKRQLMVEMHDSFVGAYGSETLLLGSVQDAIAKYTEFMGRFSEEHGIKDAGLPRLVNAEAFNSYPDFRAALLCEVNNFYLSIYYPLLMDAVDGKMNSSSAAQVTDICLTNAVAMPFTSLKRIVARYGARLLELEAALRPEIGNISALKSLILKERGHSWDYMPLPVVSDGMQSTGGETVAKS